MNEIVSVGEWIQTRRNHLGLTRKTLAYHVGCSPDTIKKIERDERRPSLQIAELLATHLQIPQLHQPAFLRMARGEYVPKMPSPTVPQIDESTPQPPKLDKFKVLGRLEALPDQKLFGVAFVRERVLKAVVQPDRPWLVAIEGIGGIGKTTLANSVVHTFLESNRFADVGWISAKQEEYVTGRGIQPTHKPAINAGIFIDHLLIQLSDGPYPVGSPNAKQAALTRLLKEKPCLIVVDNLETADDYLALLPILRMLAKPSKFIITSRMSLQNEGDVFCQSLQELTQEDALLFLRHEAKLQSIGPLLGATKAELLNIYQTTGGNPLALKLVMGQSHFLPLDHILTNLRQAKETQIDQLYAYIYWQAWHMLTNEGKQLLLSLPIVPNGTFAQLGVASKLDPLRLQQALTHLRTLSLVEVGGELNEPRYRLHRLTETFLMNEVVQWLGKNRTPESEYFQEGVQIMASHWRANQAVQQVDIETLDQEKEGILKAVHLGLTLSENWLMIKPLILALTSYMERRGHWQTWQKTVENAIDMAQKVEDLAGEIELTTVRGRILQRQNNSEGVIQNYRRVIRLARRSNNLVEEARACSNLGFAFIEKEQWWRSEILSCHALQIFNTLAYPHGQAHTHNHLGALYHKTKLWVKAEKHFKIACEIWETMGDQYGLLRGLDNLGYLYNEMGQPELAIQHLEKALDCIEKSGEQAELAAVYLNLVESYRNLGSLAEAERFAKQAETIFQQNSNSLGVFKSWENLAMIYHQSEQAERAEQYYQSALDGYRSLNYEVGERRMMQLNIGSFIF